MKTIRQMLLILPVITICLLAKLSVLCQRQRLVERKAQLCDLFAWPFYKYSQSSALRSSNVSEAFAGAAFGGSLIAFALCQR